MKKSYILVKIIFITSLIYSYSQITPGLTPDFQNWLNQNGYSKYNFMRTDIDPSGASFGGKTSASQTVNNNPVIFIHGNSDKGIGFNGWQTGWVNSIEYFMSQGYTEAELYTTTWGPADPYQMSSQVHSKEYLEYLRAFVEAVLAYTGSAKVNVIAHSMGVTLGRKILQGGESFDSTFNVGSPLMNKVDTFIGISGANWGLTNCYFNSEYPTCDAINGLYPGYAIGPFGLSEYLSDINYSGVKEAHFVYSMFSYFDDLIGYGSVVWGQITEQIPGGDGSLSYNNPTYTHLAMKTNTTNEQLYVIKNHPSGDHTYNGISTFTSIKTNQILWKACQLPKYNIQVIYYPKKGGVTSSCNSLF